MRPTIVAEGFDEHNDSADTRRCDSADTRRCCRLLLKGEMRYIAGLGGIAFICTPLISGLEERQQQLVVENTELRQCLRFMQQELNATLAHTSPTNVTQLSKSEVRFHRAGIIAKSHKRGITGLSGLVHDRLFF